MAASAHRAHLRACATASACVDQAQLQEVLQESQEEVVLVVQCLHRPSAMTRGGSSCRRRSRFDLLCCETHAFCVGVSHTTSSTHIHGVNAHSTSTRHACQR